MAGLGRLFLWASRSDRLRETLPELPFVKRSVRRFIPGERLEEGIEAARRLRERGLSSVLTHLGENVTDREEANTEVRHYRTVLEEVSGNGLDAEISVKLTHLGLDVDREAAAENLRALAEAASRHGNFVWVDMEGSDYTDVTIELFREVHSERPNVGLCLQAYLYRTPRDLEELLSEDASIRLVKGAYDEPAELAYPRKSDVDAAFGELGERLLRHADETGTRHAIGTHDLELAEDLLGSAREQGVASDRFELQMLYGIRNEALARLASNGYTGRVLISYGSEWFRWYMRRLAERPANLLFVLRSLFAR